MNNVLQKGQIYEGSTRKHAYPGEQPGYGRRCPACGENSSPYLPTFWDEDNKCYMAFFCKDHGANDLKIEGEYKVVPPTNELWDKNKRSYKVFLWDRKKECYKIIV